MSDGRWLHLLVIFDRVTIHFAAANLIIYLRYLLKLFDVFFPVGKVAHTTNLIVMCIAV